MKLLVNELISELKQGISSDKTSYVEGIRVHLYKHGTPTGSLRLEIRSRNGQRIAVSESIAIADLTEAPYFHGQVLFGIKAHLRASADYHLVLCQEGYSFSEAAYVGWCLDFDFKTYPKTSKFAHDYEIWSRT